MIKSQNWNYMDEIQFKKGNLIIHGVLNLSDVFVQITFGRMKKQISSRLAVLVLRLVRYDSLRCFIVYFPW